MSPMLSTLRSWFRNDEPVAPPVPTAGQLLRTRIEGSPAFELGRYTVIGGYSDRGYGERSCEDQAMEMLEALAEMHQVATTYDGNHYLYPINVSMAAIDWLRITYTSPVLGPISVSMPAVLDGRWIKQDIPLMIDVAATAVIDSLGVHSKETLETAITCARRMAVFGDALMHAMKDETGAHVVLPSPFGPADVRQHDSVGAPYEIYRLPDTPDFKDLPDAYEFDGWGLSLEIRRCRSMSYRGYERDDAMDVWERRRLVDRGMVYFDPTPLPNPNPMPMEHARAMAVLRNRRVLTVRRFGHDIFALPMKKYTSGTYEEHCESLGKMIGIPVRYVKCLSYGSILSQSDVVPETDVSVDEATIDQEPIAIDDICEIHWLNIDEPDRPIHDSMRHSLLPGIREALEKRS